MIEVSKKSLEIIGVLVFFLFAVGLTGGLLFGKNKKLYNHDQRQQSIISEDKKNIQQEAIKLQYEIELKQHLKNFVAKFATGSVDAVDVKTLSDQLFTMTVPGDYKEMHLQLVLLLNQNPAMSVQQIPEEIQLIIAGNERISLD